MPHTAPHPLLPIPASFAVIATRRERHDEHSVTVIRAQRRQPLHYGGAHVTTVLADDGTVYGYTRQIEGFGSDELPGRRDAERIAFDFLDELDPEHAAGLEVQWVDRHDETIVGSDGAPRSVSGMKVKTRHRSGRYTWVVVGAGGRIVTYERDVTWDTARGRRRTGMWLHDRWITARDSGGVELCAPAAPFDD